MHELKTYEVTARPTQPGSKLPQVDPMRIEATDETDAVRQAILLWGLDGTAHRYSFAAVDSDPVRRDRALAASCLRPVPSVVGYGFRK